jgi:hypothetical protein
MPTFIKTGLWEKASKSFKGWLNLDDLIKSIVPSYTITTDKLNAIEGSNNPSSTNVFATVDDIPAKRKYYTGFITQTGTNAPTITILDDDISSPVWSYSAVGTFLLTKTGAFTVNKTVPSKIDAGYDASGNLFTLERTSADVMTLKTYAAADTSTLANGVLVNQFINIEIYI